ncbi:MAG: formylglycine-generating enzyme family protein [Aphanizomenon flos-aquae KM1D3_PB]|nr:MAG: formylglycine-generating enzyme family protein [Aphanizomenon flos-aquae KM1D3_PB]
MAALEQALNYGEQGLDLVIAGLKDESVEVQEQAYILLNNWKQKQHSLLSINRTQKQQELKSDLIQKIRKFIFSKDRNQNIEEEIEINQCPETKLIRIVDSALINNIRLRLQTSDINVRIAALEQAVNYGEQGLDLVIEGLEDKSIEIQYTAYLLLRHRPETRVKKSLIEFNPQGLKLEQIEVVTVDKFGEIIQRQQRIARYFVEDLGDGVTLEMTAIPGGTFMMGSPENEAKRMDRESPQHQVTVPSFFMGKYPVTQAQYQAITGTNPSYFKPDNRPVETVNWNDAVKFCELLSERTGKKYTLPSEAQWEYACRAGNTTPFHFGETITTNLANYNCNYAYAQEPIIIHYKQEPREVGSFGVANNFGLYDMHGNVQEWCQDHWHSDYRGAPTDGSAWLENNSRIRVMRGGTYSNSPDNCRSAYRRDGDRDGRYCGSVSFRVVCTGAARI